MIEEHWSQENIKISAKEGLHARPAVKLARLAKTFESEVEVKLDHSSNWANAKSPSAVMKLVARGQSVLSVRARGEDAEEAICAIRSLVNGRFGDSKSAQKSL